MLYSSRISRRAFIPDQNEENNSSSWKHLWRVLLLCCTALAACGKEHLTHLSTNAHPVYPTAWNDIAARIKRARQS
jgi:hypothetical protein